MNYLRHQARAYSGFDEERTRQEIKAKRDHEERSNEHKIAQEPTRQLGDTAKQDLLDALEALTANKLESSIGVIVPIRYAEGRQVATKEDLVAAMDELVVRKPSPATRYASVQAAFEQGLGAYKSG
jgi:hypothetical protein